MYKNKPYSSACDENREPILNVLISRFKASTRVLEIGSGTGQHAAYFPYHLKHLVWQPSDVASNIPGIELWRKDAALSNVNPCIELDVTQAWPHIECDAVFSANTAHIMSWHAVTCMLAGVSNILPVGGEFCLYGPFKRNGTHTSESNERFDVFLRQRDPNSGVRDIEAIQNFSAGVGMSLIEDIEMPVNNRILILSRS